MKITEIEVGKVYFSCTSRDWQYARWDVKKVRVLVAEHAHWEWDRLAKQYTKSSQSFYRSKKGIVVEVLNAHLVVETCVVPLGSIKGLWDVVAPVVESNRKARKDAEDTQTASVRVAYDLAWANVQKAGALGLKGVDMNLTRNTVTPETLAMLLEVWAAHREA